MGLKNKELASEYRRQYYLDNREHTLEINRQWRKNNKKKDKDLKRRYHLKKYFGITLEEYDQMMADQDGTCAICNEPCFSKPSLAVDHCHDTNRIRGLLCHQCNVGLGAFKDSTHLLKEAIKYLDGMDWNDSY